jgi:putative endonuclease
MAMHYVYILESLTVPGHFYIGYTDNLRERVRKHHSDVSAHAAKFRPWKLKRYVALDTKAKALRFERYLKSGSGRVSAKDISIEPVPGLTSCAPSERSPRSGARF